MTKLLKWIKPYMFIFIIICLFTIIVPTSYSYVPQFIKYIFDYCLGKGNAVNTLPLILKNFFANYTGLSAIIVVCLTLVVYQIIRGLLMFVNGYLKGLFQEGIALNMRNKLYSHIQRLPLKYHKDVDTGDLIQRCTSDIDTIKQFLSNQIVEILYVVASIVAGAVQMASVNKNIMLITLLVLPINLVSSIIYFSYVKKRFEYIEKVEGKMTSTLEENINGARVVKAFNIEKSEIDKFDERNKEYRDESRKLNLAMAKFWGFSDGITVMQYSVTIGYCIFLAMNSKTSFGDILVCISYISMLVYPIRSLGRIIGSFGKAIVSNNRIFDVLKETDEYELNGTLKPKIIGNITFDNVSFKFEDSNDYLLNNLSFTINQGESIAIVGKTGCGKSTLINLLSKMTKDYEGSIYIDGVDITKIDTTYLRNNVGVILQDPFLFNRSIVENVRIAAPSKSIEDVISATSSAFIHQDVLSFDKQYETMVGEKGVTLSGGQKQRLAIARTLILNKPIIIFDDSLSAVDTTTDKYIRNALRKKENTTSIIITHRITTAKECDKIIVLNNGVVENIGTHNELKNTKGLYKDLWDIQGALEDEFINLVNKEVS